MNQSGPICLGIESMLLEVHIEMNLRNQDDEFHNKEKVNNGAKGRNQEDQRKVEKWTQ